ncbi:MAG: filamentous hemagglutinin N-terminal domain-containing protein [Oscillatoriales cyanobacterium C42_A2020_001]|nr:filamentous hemagglutinin N-terminal domain-containing protein [Leptolyngbyaceae cyanobacterium C42_A2020_001]
MKRKQTRRCVQVFWSRLVCFCVFPGWAIAAALPVPAQIAADATLGNEFSQVTQPAANTFLIEGGAVRGSNLFHSFSTFSVGEGQTARFSPPTQIQTIFSRVTGGQASTILGTVRVDGTANLFLINPSGMIFGPNAQLSLGGSFVATTASDVVFPNGDRFSAVAPVLPSSLLTVNPSALFYSQLAPAPITANARLTVPTGKTLALVGGEVSLDGARLTAPGGRVELGGLATAGLINLGGDFRLILPADSSRANVALNRSAIDVRALGGGNIAIAAQNLTIAASPLTVGINQTGAAAQAGNIEIDATGTVTLAQGSNLFNGVLTAQAVGSGGSIVIRANNLVMQSRAQLNTSTLGQGNAGNIIIQVQDSIELGETTGIRSSVRETAIGNGGTIRIQARSLSLTSGAQIAAAVVQGGRGDAGNVAIDVADTVTISGVDPVLRSATGTPFPSGLIVSNETPLGGNAGDITINTGKLILSDRGQIAATTSNGDGGNITLNAREYVLLRNSGTISTTAGGIGAGGNGGNITLSTPFVLGVLTENSDISANAFTGRGGRVSITAQGIYGLKFQPRPTPFSDITASSQFGVSGTVILSTPDLDPSRGVDALSTTLVDPSNQIVVGCSASNRLNRFVVTGRGGLPTYPEEALLLNNPLVELAQLVEPAIASQAGVQEAGVRSQKSEVRRDEGGRENEGGRGVREWTSKQVHEIPPTHPPTHSSTSPSPPSLSPIPYPPSPIIEAQGWVVDQTGETVLVAHPPRPAASLPLFATLSCPHPPPLIP